MDEAMRSLAVWAVIVFGILLGLIIGDVRERHRGFDIHHRSDKKLADEQQERMAGYNPREAAHHPP